jgi:LmbE family N-acetylglucosaminyl deacetylase
MTPDTVENWEGQKKILIILAHPDDPEFFCGATIRRWTQMGHQVRYCLLTRGDKGSNDRNMRSFDLAVLREVEQNAAAKELGVENVRFLDYEDGCLVPSLETRKRITRIVREECPDILVSCDPTNFFPNEASINHPDHRAAGQIVVEAIFPATGNPLYFPELLLEGLEPHSVKEVWLSVTAQPNVVIDVTATWEDKIRALKCHRSQIGDPAKLEERIRSRRAPDSSEEAPRYEEKFRRFIFGR